MRRIADYPRLPGETNDNGRMQRASAAARADADPTVMIDEMLTLTTMTPWMLGGRGVAYVGTGTRNAQQPPHEEAAAAVPSTAPDTVPPWHEMTGLHTGPCAWCGKRAPLATFIHWCAGRWRLAQPRCSRDCHVEAFAAWHAERAR